MTVDELVEQVLARALDLGASFPGARSVLYRRIGVRQQQLFAAAARSNPEYFGVSAVGTLTAGKVDLADTGDPDAAEPVYAPELIYRMEIADAGTSPYAAGEEVHVVPLNDREAAAFPPRVTLRNLLIAQVGTDLQDVTSVRVYYSRRPFPLRPTEGGNAIDFPEAFQELLVIDLARWLVRKTFELAADVRSAAAAALTEEEGELLGNLEQEVRQFTVGAEVGRFGRTTGVTHQ